MKQFRLHSRVFTVIALMLIGGLVGANHANAQQATPVRAHFQAPTGPVPRGLLLDTAPPTVYRSDVPEATLDAFSKVDRCVEALMSAYRIPGASIAIIDNGSQIYEKGYGIKNKEQGGAVTPGTVFRFGSTLKMMTAAAVMQQVEKGLVDLQAPITEYIPEFQVAGPWAANTIKVWNLLTHTSSFPDRYDELMFRNGLAGPTTPTALADWAAGQSAIPLFAPPGSFWNYSNPNFSLAALIVQKTSGKEYHQYMQDHVFGPAGMTNTTLLPSEVMTYGDYAYEHYRDSFTGAAVIAAPDAYDNWIMAPAGLGFATARDLARFANLLMSGGGDVITPQSAEIMQSQQVDTQTGDAMYYGFGVMNLPDYYGEDLRMHGGNVFGSAASLIWAPEHTFAVALLFNGAASPDDAALCAYNVFHPLTGAAPPNTSLAPSEWGRYEGNYQGRFFGHWNWKTMGEIVTYDGLEISAQAVKIGNRLILQVPQLSVTDSLTPIGLDVFLASKLGPLSPLFDAGFLDDPETQVVSNFIRNRQFVLIREESSSLGPRR